MKINKLLSLVALSFSGLALAQEKSLATLVNEKDAFLVDVRSEKEFEAGSATHAVNIPLENIEKELSQFQGKTNIIVFCRSGKRSEAAKKLLAKHNIQAKELLFSSRYRKRILWICSPIVPISILPW